MSSEWAELTRDKKRAERFAKRLAPPGVNFQSPEAEQRQVSRADRFAEALEVTYSKLYKWPGHGVSENTLSCQAADGEWMTVDEYDPLISAPIDCWLKTCPNVGVTIVIRPLLHGAAAFMSVTQYGNFHSGGANLDDGNPDNLNVRMEAA